MADSGGDFDDKKSPVAPQDLIWGTWGGGRASLSWQAQGQVRMPREGWENHV